MTKNPLINIIVRSAELADADGIAKVHVETWQCAYSGQIADSYLQSLSVKKRAEKWKQILSDPEANAQTFVALVDKKLVGFCSVSKCRDEDMLQSTGELWSIYVDIDTMGHGVGTALLNKGRQYLKENGYSRATLWVLISNEKTRMWYESRGWKVEGKVKTERSRGIDMEEIRYICDL